MCCPVSKKSSFSPSLFCKFPINKADSFSWDQCVDELKTKAPILLKLLTYLVSWSDHRNKAKKGNKHNPGVCMALSVLLKEPNREMSGIQTLNSLLLFSSRASRRYVCVCVCV